MSDFPESPSLSFFFAALDREFAATTVIWLGWLMAGIGALKLTIFLVGEFFPSFWEKVKSSAFRKLLTGAGNRFLFGLGGLITVILGLAAVGIGYLIRYINNLA